MPAKLERCVAKLKEEGKSEESAYAICNASISAADAGFVIDASTMLNVKLDPVTGFLTAPVTLARTGIQHYYGFELGLEDRMLEKIGVYRPAEEVFHPDSLASFMNLVVTDDHPNSFVTVDNVKKLQRGQVSGVGKADDESIAGIVTITDAEQIGKAKKGKIEVSVGYSNDLKQESGTYKGESYEFIQTNIRANHLAIVDAGRCGGKCKLTLDKEKDMKVIIIDGIEYKVEDDQLAQAIQKYMKDAEASKEEMQKKLDEEEEAKKEAMAAKDKALAEKDAMMDSALSDKDISRLVSERANLIATGKRILGDKMPECMDCPAEIKTAVIESVFEDVDLKDKSDDYVNAMFDMAVKKADRAKTSVDNLKGDFEEKVVETEDGKKVTRDSARENYMKSQLNL